MQVSSAKIPHIRLNMIVKNEAHVILRCLASVKPWIQSWVIVDTGSTDGTQQLIQDFMHDVPGQLYERPWRNFGFNRTEALKLAQSPALDTADYVLFIDADETLKIDDDVDLSKLNQVAYYFTCHYFPLTYQRNALVSTRLKWHWQGVLHEYLLSPEPHIWQSLPGAHIYVQHDGARGKDQSTYLKDIAVLEQALKDEPHNTRYMFYLAQSYKDAGLLSQAREMYLKRAQYANFPEEQWTAQFRAAKLAEALNLSAETIYTEYLQSWIQRQTRAEPLYELARYYREHKRFDLACYFADQACQIKMPYDILFVDKSIYEWRALDELAVSAYYCPAYLDKGRAAIVKLIRDRKFPVSMRPRLLQNLKSYVENKSA